MPVDLTIPPRQLLYQLPNPVAFLDASFKVQAASKPWLRKFNLNETDIQGQSIFDLFPTFSSDWSTKLNYALEGLEDIQILDQTYDPNNGNGSFVWQLNPWTNTEGQPIGVVLSVKDTTELSALKLELQKTRTQLQEKSRLAKIGNWEYNVDSDQVFLSPAIQQLFNLKTPDTLPLQQALALYKDGPSRKAMINAIDAAVNHGTPWDHHIEIAVPGATPQWVNVIGRPKFKDGRCTRISGTMQDVSGKMSLASPHTVAPIVFEGDALLEHAPTPTAIVDFHSGTILSANQALETLTGYSKKRMLHQPHFPFNVFPTRSREKTVVDQLRKKGTFRPFEFGLKINRKTTLRLRVAGKTLKLAPGKRVVICSFTDLSPEYKQTKLLRAQLTDAKRQVEKLVNFAHMVCHQLKAHATNFSLLLQFLEQETDLKGKNKLIAILKNGNKGLLDTIGDLRELVAIKEHNREKHSALYLISHVYHAEEQLAGMIRKHQVKIINEIPEDIRVIGLAPYLDSVFSNLVSNAIRFRKKQVAPMIVVSAKETKDHVIVTIEDNGIGMDLSKNPKKLFEPYATMGNNPDASGLGLYLTKYQMELMQGKVSVESTLGEGATFQLYFPRKKE